MSHETTPLMTSVAWFTDLGATALDVGRWIASHAVVLSFAAGICWLLARLVQARLADRASRDRVCFRLSPNRRFDPDLEQIWRYAALLSRSAGSGPWWAPRRAKAVRLRLRADGTKPLDFLVEGPGPARHLLATSPYANMKITKATPRRDKARRFSVRAEFVLTGTPVQTLRTVPLDPDPLQPLIDAVADVRADLGDLTELCLDIQRIPRWQIQLRRWQVLAVARQRQRQAAAKESRQAFADAVTLEDTWHHQIAALLAPASDRGRGTRWTMPTRPRRLDEAKALGKLSDSAGLVRVQLLARCSSDTAGRPEIRLKHLQAALDVFGGGQRIALAGKSFGPWRTGADSWWRRRSFDGRWSSAQCAPMKQNWVRVEELTGLLKPPTVHCRLPVLLGELPVYIPGRTGLMPHGWYTGPDGVERLIATPEEETLFSLSVGKSTYGKTEKAMCQAVARAHGGGGLLFIDPHGDSWKRAAPYLAHPAIMARAWCLDLTGAHPDTRLGTWNPLGLERGQKPDDVVRSVTDAFATVLGWNDLSAPRAMTIFTKACEALVAYNAAAVAARRPDAQATIFQIGTLLTEASVRDLLILHLEPKQRRWWHITFPALPADAFPTVINPIERLSASRVALALLGSPTSSYDIRSAMDQRKVVWICPSSSGPTDRLLVSLIIQDLLRAGMSRRDLPEDQRVPFHIWLDELISLDGAASTTLAEITEQMRKFGLRLHAMAQLLQRVSEHTRSALIQNSSALATTAGSHQAAALFATEWGGAVDTADITELPRFEHYMSFTVRGRRIGPLRLRGPEIDEVFSRLKQPGKVRALTAAAVTALAARPLPELTAIAAGHDTTVCDYLRSLPPKDGLEGEGAPFH